MPSRIQGLVLQTIPPPFSPIMAGSSSSGDAWPQAYHLDVNAMRSYSASRVAELAKEAGPTLGLYKRIQSETPMYVVSLVDCYTQKGWLETQLNLPIGRIYTGSSHLNNPVCGAYDSHGPVQSRLHPGPEYADERFRTGPCPTLSTRIGRRGLGPLWLGCGEGEKSSPGPKLWVINRRGEFGPPSAVKFGRLRGIKEWRSRALSRSSSKYVGMGLFLLCFLDRYGPLQESVGPNEGLVAEAISGGISECGWALLNSGHGYAAAWDFAFKGEGFRHCWWAFDYDGYSGWALDYDHGSPAAIERNRERERSRSRPKVLPPKHIPVRQSMVAINLDAPIPVPGPNPASKADPQLPPQNFVMVVHPMWRPPPPPTMPLGPAGAAVPPGADVMVKAMPPPPTPTPIIIRMWW